MHSRQLWAMALVAALSPTIALANRATTYTKTSAFGSPEQACVETRRDGGAVVAANFTLLLVGKDGTVSKAVSHQPQTDVLAIDENSIFLARDLLLGKLLVARVTAEFEKAWAWDWEVGTSEDGVFVHSLTATRDGGVLVVGAIEKTAFAARLESTGDLRWMHAFDLSGNEEFRDAAELPDGSFLLVGVHDLSGWIAKISDKGELLWQKSGYASEFRTLAAMTNGDFLAAGRGFLMRFTAAGEIRWQRAIELNVYGAAVDGQDSIALTGMQGKKTHILAFLTPNGEVRSAQRLASEGEPRKSVAAAPGGWYYAYDDARTVKLLAVDPAGVACDSNPNFPLQVQTVEVAPHTLPITTRAMHPVRRIGTFTLQPGSGTAGVDACESTVAAPTPLAGSTPSPVTTHRMKLENDAAAWTALVKRRDFAALEQIGSEFLRKQWSEDPVHWDINAFVWTIAVNSALTEQERFDFLQDWISKRPDAPLPRLALAIANLSAGEARRGGGFADTVTESGAEGMHLFFGRAREALDQAEAARSYPAYWTTRIVLASSLGSESLIGIVREAAKFTSDPNVFETALYRTVPKWGGSVEAAQAMIEEAASLTRATWGDAIYTWLAYQAPRQMDPADKQRLRFDWKRIDQGCRDLVARSTAWPPSHHRCAVLAEQFSDGRRLRELFRTRELGWYEGAERMWYTRDRYETVKAFALELETAPDHFLGTPSSWPDVLLQLDSSNAGANATRTTAVLVKDGDGVAALTVWTPPSAGASPSDATIPMQMPAANPEWMTKRFAASKRWTLESSGTPRESWTVTGVRTKAPVRDQHVVLLSVKQAGKQPKTPILELASPTALPRYVVACTWVGKQCRQTVLKGFSFSIPRDYGAPERGLLYRFSPESPLQQESLAGAVALDAVGRVVGIVIGRAQDNPDHIEIEQAALAVPAAAPRDESRK
jgi:hypothetical protein